MSKSIIAEGNTTNHAIENGLKELNVTRDMVDIKVLEEEKRSFFSILAPRVVKVQLTIKEDMQEDKKKKKTKTKIEKLSTEEQDLAYRNIDEFLKQFIKNLPEGIEYSIEKSETDMKVSLNNQDLGYLIGYRGETLYALQNIISSIASKGIEHRVRVILDIEVLIVTISFNFADALYLTFRFVTGITMSFSFKSIRFNPSSSQKYTLPISSHLKYEPCQTTP